MRSTRARLRSRPLPDVEAVLLGGRADAAWPRRRATLALAALLAGACTAPSVQGSAIALDDPLGLIDDVEAAGNDLRLLVLPDESYDCDSATGRLAPEPPDAAMIGDAVVDVSVDIAGGSVSASDVSVPPGDWVVLVRGKGTDPTSGVRDAIIASGCAAVAMLASGETREVAITLRPVIT